MLTAVPSLTGNCTAVPGLTRVTSERMVLVHSSQRQSLLRPGHDHLRVRSPSVSKYWVCIDETVRPGTSPAPVVRVCVQCSRHCSCRKVVGALMSRAGSGGWERESPEVGEQRSQEETWLLGGEAPSWVAYRRRGRAAQICSADQIESRLRAQS